MPRLLDALQLKSAVVTIDAAGTQCSIAEQIHEAGADYILSLQANQKITLAAVKACFASAPRPALQSTVTLEKNHGRCERREYRISEDLSWFHKSWKWPGLLSVARARRVVPRGKTGPPPTEVHFYQCTIPADAKRLAALVRAHWSVANRSHWVLEVVFGEDHSQGRDTAAAHNLSMLREMALKALGHETAKTSLRSKRKRASLDPAFRLGLLPALQAEALRPQCYGQLKSCALFSGR